MFDRETTDNWELGAKTSWLESQADAEPDLLPDGHQAASRTARSTEPASRSAMQATCATRASSLTVWPSRCATCRCSPAWLTSIPSSRNMTMRRPSGLRPTHWASHSSGLPGAAYQGQRRILKGEAATFAPKWSGRVGFDWTGDFGSRIHLGPELEPVVRFEAVWRPRQRRQPANDHRWLRVARRPGDRQRSGRPLVGLAVRQQPAGQAV